MCELKFWSKDILYKNKIVHCKIEIVSNNEFELLYNIINDAAQAYRGVIPPDRWHDPYMSVDELRFEINDGVVFYGFYLEGSLKGVMGIQDKGEVCLIRHSYILTEYQKSGFGGYLMEYLHTQSDKPMLIGTWSAADWAIHFYQKHGFRLVENTAHKNELLRRFWTIPERQVETSVVLEEDLLVLSAKNQQKARCIIQKCRLIEAWESIGATVRYVGSLATGLLMKHRDIDLHIYTSELNPAESFRAISQIGSLPAIQSLQYTNLAKSPEECLEWHCFYRDDEDTLWQIDMIQIRSNSDYDGYFERVAERICAVLTPETRYAILYLKNMTPPTEYIGGIEYCQAVIADGIRTWEEFVLWRQKHPANGINRWCP